MAIFKRPQFIVAPSFTVGIIFTLFFVRFKETVQDFYIIKAINQTQNYKSNVLKNEVVESGAFLSNISDENNFLKYNDSKLSQHPKAPTTRSLNLNEHWEKIK